MSRRVAGWLSWSLVAISIVCVVLASLLERLNASAAGIPEPPIVQELWPLSWLGFTVLGAVVLSRRPGNRIGWILIGIGFGISANIFVVSYARYTLVTDPGAFPLGRLAGWLAASTGALGIGLIPLLILLFPSGRMAFRGGRAVAHATAAVLGTVSLWMAIAPVEVAGGSVAGLPRFKNPYGIDALAGVADSVTSALGTSLAALGMIAVVHALWRLHRGSPEEREQLKWFAYACAMVPVIILGFGTIANSVSGSVSEAITVVSFVVSFNGVAAGIGVAIFKYRLYDIDRIINKTLVYGVATVLLALGYAGVVIGLQAVLPQLARDSAPAVAASTLAMVALFRPLRNRIQGFVDRRFYRRRYDAARTIESFGSRLRQETDLDSLRGELLVLVKDTMQPAHVSLWLRAPVLERES